MKSVEIEAGLPMLHNNDFIQLAELIFKETHEHISPTTLKRLWGYVSDQNCEPRVSTLDLLSKLLGYRNFNDFSKDGGGVNGEKRRNNTRLLAIYS